MRNPAVPSLLADKLEILRLLPGIRILANIPSSVDQCRGDFSLSLCAGRSAYKFDKAH